MSNYRAQGCGFVAACVAVGFILSVATSPPDGTPAEATDVFEAPNGESLVIENEQGHAASGAAAEQANAPPKWLVGIWAPPGECGLEDGYHFRFGADGVLATNDLSGTYTVDDGTIIIEGVQASADVLNQLGGDIAQITFERNSATGEVAFGGKPVERCDV